ncbi:complement C1q and tumor necrosis factor-related protein 9-like [Babylonia areolata]|uniref:complement C1q and tumor necrosis factor-related protein 9-like n=1 Tax=Babylonia areolata TaxID=304850 RepID=UPI003FD2C782
MFPPKKGFSNFSILLLFLFATATRSEFRNHPRRSSSLASLQNVINQQANLIQALQSELSATENRLEEVENQLGSRVEALENSDVGNKNQFAVLSSKLSQSVAFTVRFSKDPIPNVGQHAVLKFDSVQFNLGGGYNTGNGIFTAPISGVYAFFLSLMGSWQWSELSLVKDGSVIDSVHVNDETFDQGSLFETIHLDAGQMVWVQHSYGSTAIKGGAWTDFSGFLLKAD